MKQKGTVIDTDKDFATVEVMRTSACVGCSKQEGCIACRKKTKTLAYNPIGAKKGDKVDLESKSSTVLLYAALVFVLPVLLAVSGYVLASYLFKHTALQIIIPACIFISAYVIIYFVFDRNPKTKKSVVITNIDIG